MALNPDEIVAQIILGATDEASPAINEVGQTMTDVAGRVETQGKRINSVFQGFTGSATAARQNVSSEMASMATQVDTAAGKIADAGKRAQAGWSGVGSAAGAGKRTGFDLLAGQAADAATRIETACGRIQTASFDAFNAVGDDAVTAADYVSSAVKKIEASAVRAEAALKKIGGATMLANPDMFAAMQADLDALVVQAQESYAKITGFAQGSVDKRIALEDGYAAAVERANARILKNEETTATRRAELRTQGHSGSSSSGSGSSRGERVSTSMNRGGNASVAAGASLLAIPLAAGYEAANFNAAGQATAGNANISPAVQNAVNAQVMKIFKSGPVGYGDLFSAEQRAAETFTKPAGMSNSQYAKELESIIASAWMSAVGSHGSITTISGALAQAMHNWDVAPKNSLRAMDVLHSVAAYAGGGTTVETLSQNMTRSSAAASIAGMSMPQWGGLFAGLAKQFGPAKTDTYLASLEQKMMAQTPAAQKDLQQLGLGSEFNKAGLAEYGPFKLLQDLKDRLELLPKKEQGNFLQQIIPAQRGGLAFMSLEKGNHLQEAENLTQKLGGSLGPGGPATGQGAAGDVANITTTMFDRMMAQVKTKFQTFINDIKGTFAQIGQAILPGLEAAMKAVGPVVDGIGNFLGKHPEWIKNAAELGTVLLGVGVAMKGIAIAAELVNPWVALAGAFALAYTNIKPFHDAVNNLTSHGLNLAKQAIDDFTGSSQKLTPAAETMRDRIADSNNRFQDVARSSRDAKSGLDAVESVIGKIGDGFSHTVDFVKNFAQEIAKTVGPSKEWGDVLKSLSSAGKEIMTAIGPVISLFGSFNGSAKNSSNSGRELAQVLSGVLRVAAEGLGIAIKVMADVVVTQIHLIEGVITLLADLFRNTAKVIGDQVTLVMDIIHGKWGKIPDDLKTMAGDILNIWKQLGIDVVKVVAQFVKDVLTTFGDTVGGIIKWFQHLFDVLVGHSIIPDLCNAILKWFSELPGKILGALKDFFTGLPQKFLTLGKDMMSSIAQGVADNAGKLKTAAVNAAQGAATAAGNILGQIGNKVGQVGNAINGPNTPGGGGYVSGANYGAFGGSSANYASSNDVSMLNSMGIHPQGTVMDTDFPTGSGQSVPYRLPTGGAYTLVSQGESGDFGGYEVWKNTKNGGTIMFLHGLPVSGGNPSPFSTGQTVAGGTYVGKSGHAITHNLGNDPSFWHLCVVTDTGERVWLSDAQMQQYVRGKSRGGGGPLNLDARYSPSQQANAQIFGPLASSIFNPGTPTPGLPINVGNYGTVTSLATQGKNPQTYQTFSAAIGGAKGIGSEIPDLLAQVESLPKELGDPLKNSLESMSGDWEKYLDTYNTTIEKENTKHAANLTKIKDTYQHQVENILARYDAKTQSGAAKEALSIANDLSKQHPGYYTTTGGTYVAGKAGGYTDVPTHTAYKTVTTKGTYSYQNGKEVYVGPSSHQEAYTVGDHKVYHAPTQGHRTPVRQVYHKGKDETAAINELESKYGITQSEAEQLLGVSLNNAGYNAKGAVGRENTRHTAAVSTAQDTFEKNINSLQGKLNQFVKDLRSAFDPAQIISALHSEYQKAAASAQAGLALHLYKGDLTDQTTVTPLTNAQKRQNALLAQNGGAPEYTAQSTTATAQQQMNAMVQRAAEKALADEKLTAAENQAAGMVALATGNVADFQKSLQTASDEMQQGFYQALVSGRGVQQQFITGMAQVADDQEILANGAAGLSIKIDAVRGDFDDMSKQVQTLSTSALRQWNQSILQGQGVLNSHLKDIQADARATEDLTTRQNLQSVVIGRLTGNYQTLSTGLQGLLSQATDKLNFWIASIGRSDDGLQTTAGDVTQLGDKVLATADNLGTFDQILQAVQGAASQMLNGIETQFTRTGSVSPANLAEYTKATQQATTLTWDQVAADLQATKAAGDLTGYQQALGKEVTLLTSQLSYMKANGQEGTAQFQQLSDMLARVQKEYEGLGYVTQSLDGKTQLTAEQLDIMNAAMADFRNQSDSGTLALKGHTGQINADKTAMQQLEDSTKQTATEVDQLGTAAVEGVTGINSMVSALIQGAAAVNGMIANLKGGGGGSGNASALNPNGALANMSKPGLLGAHAPGSADNATPGGDNGGTNYAAPYMPKSASTGSASAVGTANNPFNADSGVVPSGFTGYFTRGGNEYFMAPNGTITQVTVVSGGSGSGSAPGTGNGTDNSGLPTNPYDGLEATDKNGTHYVWDAKTKGWVAEVQIPDPSGALHWVSPNSQEYKDWLASQGQGGSPAPGTDMSGSASSGGDSTPPSVGAGASAGGAGSSGTVSDVSLAGYGSGSPSSGVASSGSPSPSASSGANPADTGNAQSASALNEMANAMMQGMDPSRAAALILTRYPGLPQSAANLISNAALGLVSPDQLIVASDYYIRQIGSGTSGTSSGVTAAIASGSMGGGINTDLMPWLDSSGRMFNAAYGIGPSAEAIMQSQPGSLSRFGSSPVPGPQAGWQAAQAAAQQAAFWQAHPPATSVPGDLNPSGSWLTAQGTVTTGYSQWGWSGQPVVGNTIQTPYGAAKVIEGGRVQVVGTGEVYNLPPNNFVEYPRQGQPPGLRGTIYDQHLSRDYSQDGRPRQSNLDHITKMGTWGSGEAVSPMVAGMVAEGYAFPEGPTGPSVYVGYGKGWVGGPGGTVSQQQFSSGMLPGMPGVSKDFTLANGQQVVERDLTYGGSAAYPIQVGLREYMDPATGKNWVVPMGADPLTGRVSGQGLLNEQMAHPDANFGQPYQLPNGEWVQVKLFDINAAIAAAAQFKNSHGAGGTTLGGLLGLGGGQPPNASQFAIDPSKYDAASDYIHFRHLGFAGADGSLWPTKDEAALQGIASGINTLVQQNAQKVNNVGDVLDEVMRILRDLRTAEVSRANNGVGTPPDGTDSWVNRLTAAAVGLAISGVISQL